MSANICLPEEFIKLMEASVGKEASDLFVGQYNDAAGGVTSIRSNPGKGGNGMLLENAEFFGGTLRRVVWCSNGHYLAQRPLFTLDPLFHAGAYYVQDASSMFSEVAMKAIMEDAAWDEGKLRLLDLCAAPGGKSTHILSLLGENSLLVSNEVIKSRSVVLADNIAKWGSHNVVVSNNDPRDFKSLSEYFNIIFVDAPCSGEGMFRKEPETVNEWSMANVELCAARQRRILQDIWPALAPGGYLVYSTCTFNHFENDGNLEFLINEMGAEPVDVAGFAGNSEYGNILKTSHGGFQFVPGMVEGEGQFFAIVKKSTLCGEKSRFRIPGMKPSGNLLKKFPYLPLQEYDFELKGDMVKAYPKGLANEIRFLETKLKIVSSGVAAAIQKGRDFIPHADLALSEAFSEMISQGKLPEGINAVEVSRDDALKFLAKEPLVLPGAPSGYILLIYKGVGLGFVKNLGNRTNNLLPMARRIRMSIAK